MLATTEDIINHEIKYCSILLTGFVSYIFIRNDMGVTEYENKK